MRFIDNKAKSELYAYIIKVDSFFRCNIYCVIYLIFFYHLL